jgi:hypothetical protein
VHLKWVSTLIPEMKALNEWYLNQKSVQIGTRYKDTHMYNGTISVLWVLFKELSDFNNILALDVHILCLWTM